MCVWTGVRGGEGEKGGKKVEAVKKIGEKFSVVRAPLACACQQRVQEELAIRTLFSPGLQHHSTY